jgi:hypothetical protein
MYTLTSSESVEEITERPVIIIPDLYELSHLYNNKQPQILKDYRGNEKYLNGWRDQQLILYEFIMNCNGTYKDIEDPSPYHDSWYIFGVRPFIDKMICTHLLD